MEHVAKDQRWGISGGVPAGVTVALKDGWLPLDAAATTWQVNSIGWVSGAGRDYLLAVLSTGNPTEPYVLATISAVLPGVERDALDLAPGLQLPGWYWVRPYCGDRLPRSGEAVLSVVACWLGCHGGLKPGRRCRWARTSDELVVRPLGA
jgi:hypothetical protein